MTRYALLLLFFITLGAPALGLEVSIAPGLSVKNALLYSVVAGIALEWTIAKNRRLEVLPIILPFGALVMYAFFSWLVVVLLVDYTQYSALRTFIFLKSNLADHLIIFLAFFYGVTKTSEAWWLLRLLIWIVIASNIITVIDGFNIPDLGVTIVRRDGRMGGLVGDSNDYGAFVAFSLPAIVALFLSSSGKSRPIALLGVLASIIGLAISASRGAYVSAVVGSVLAAFYLRSYIPGRAIVQYLVSFVLVGIVAGVIVLNTDYGKLLEARFTETQASGKVQDLSSGRSRVWLTAVGHMLQTPTSFVTGYGWHAYENGVEQGTFRFATHNRYLNLLYNLGLIGLLLFLLMAANVLKLLRQAIPAADSETKPFLIALVFGFSAMLVSLVFADIHAPWIFIWAFCGLAVRLAANTVSEAAPPAPIGVRTEIVRHKGPAWQGTMSRAGAAKRPLSQ